MSAPRAPAPHVDEQHRAWMRLPSGRRLDLISPDPQAWCDEDLAIRLARTFRWGGESCWSTPLSVAQHSLHVLEIARQSACGSLSPPEQLRELLHDAEEGFLGFDCIAPLKPALGAPFRLVADRLSAAVWERYALPVWDTGSYGRHKDADEMSAASEAVHAVGWTLQEVRSVLGIEAPILQTDPLAEIYGCEPWRPWPVDVAAERLLSALQGLIIDRDWLLNPQCTSGQSGVRNPAGEPDACAAGRELISLTILAEACEVHRNGWDFHPRSSLPDEYQLVSFPDGVWIVERGFDLNAVKRYAMVLEAPERRPPLVAE